MNDQFVLLLNKSYLNSGKPRNSGQFMTDQTFHYCKSTLYFYFDDKAISRIYLGALAAKNNPM